MGFSREVDVTWFSVLGMRGSDTAFSVRADATVDEIRAFGRGERNPDVPVRLRWRSGRRTPSDVIWATVGMPVGSPRLLDLLRQFTGWHPYPIELIGRDELTIQGFSGVAITGRCGPTRFDTSRIEGVGPAADYVGMLFDVDTWDGSDIFHPPHQDWCLVSERLGQELRRSRITNIELTPLAEMRVLRASYDAWNVSNG